MDTLKLEREGGRWWGGQNCGLGVIKALRLLEIPAWPGISSTGAKQNPEIPSKIGLRAAFGAVLLSLYLHVEV